MIFTLCHRLRCAHTNPMRWNFTSHTIIIGFSLALASCGGSISGGPPILPPRQAPPQIFDSYLADRDANMADGWTKGMDMSGVSFNDKRTATLITRRHVVMAKHYTRPAGAPVVFHDRSGKRIERKIIGFAAASGDVMVGLLNEAVPANYRLLPPAINLDRGRSTCEPPCDRQRPEPFAIYSSGVRNGPRNHCIQTGSERHTRMGKKPR